jgi:hypothetical protein
LEALGTDVSEMILSLYYFFHGWPSQREDYFKCQRQQRVSEKCLIKHSPTRWLTLNEAASRLLEQ